jgi:hypothetical protein
VTFIIVVIIKTGKMRWMGRGIHMGEIRNVCRISVAGPEVRRSVEDVTVSK